MLRNLTLAITTLWVGGLWITGFSVNRLFDVVLDRSLAGDIAGTLFNTISYIGMASATYLLAYCLIAHGRKVLSHLHWWVIVIMLLLILVGQFGIQPWLAQIREMALPNEVMKSQYAKQFAAWHVVAGVLYLLECLLGLVLVVKIHKLSQR